MSDLDELRRLRRLAKIATPGPWHVGYRDGSGSGSITAPDTRPGAKMDERSVVRGGSDGWGVPLGVEERADAAYVAAANPAVILDLLDRLAATSDPAPLDAAWNEAEAALPEGWWIARVSDESPTPLHNQEWMALAHGPYLIVASGTRGEVFAQIERLPPKALITTITSEPGDHVARYESSSIEASGPTPAAALQALAAKLRDTTGREPQP